MKIIRSRKLNLIIIYPSIFSDHRGIYLESFNVGKYKKILKKNFLEEDICFSKKNVFRGIHGDNKTWKLISCSYGKCMSIIFNCDKDSKNFGKWEKFILDSKNYFQILVPPKYGNSFIVLSKTAVYQYKQTMYYSGNANQFTYNIKDPFFKVRIKNIKKLIFSERDKNANFVN
jgi:dTDP-4-dehydrorhamnose 3,5-epimerase